MRPMGKSRGKAKGHHLSSMTSARCLGGGSRCVCVCLPTCIYVFMALHTCTHIMSLLHSCTHMFIAFLYTHHVFIASMRASFARDVDVASHALACSWCRACISQVLMVMVQGVHQPSVTAMLFLSAGRAGRPEQHQAGRAAGPVAEGTAARLCPSTWHEVGGGWPLPGVLYQHTWPGIQAPVRPA